MKIYNLFREAREFGVFETTALSQTAVMRLSPGGSSSAEPAVHPGSDQIVLVAEGRLRAEIGGESRALERGDIVTVAAGTPHRFVNPGDEAALAFTAYSPPAY